jgi:GT2 family glycosyltransferase
MLMLPHGKNGRELENQGPQDRHVPRNGRNRALDLSVIVVSHGHGAVLEDCLRSLPNALAGLCAEVIVVDNLGTDAGAAAAVNGHDRTTLYRSPRPQGLSQNINQAARKASGRYLLLLNPDTVFRSGSLSDAIRFMEGEPRAGVVGCRLLSEDGTLQHSYRRFPTAAVVLARGLGADRWKRRPRFYRDRLMEGVRLEDTTEVDWVFGAFLLVRFDRFLALGGMDERFRLYYEDVDLCYRFRQRGWRTFYFPGVSVVHQHARSSAAKPLGQAWRWHLRSACRFFWKHGYIFHPPPGGPET